MIPYRDLNRTARTPWVVIGLITINIGVFLFTWNLMLRGEPEVWIIRYAFTPADLLQLLRGDITALPVTLGTMISAQFLHAGWLHLGSNMLYLWIFGDNVEAALGRIRFLIFYLVSGVVAMTTEALVHTGMADSPILGASGAVAGVLGAYLLLYPKARILVLVPIFIFLRTFALPAWLMLGYWVLLQGVGAHASRGASAGGGIAYFAHLGGFLTGLFLCWRLMPQRSRKQG